MSRQLSYMLVADGGTDRALVPLLDWAIHQIDPEVEILEPEFRKRKGSIPAFMGELETGVMMIFVHRDGETASLEDRLQEFDGIERDNVVPVIPIRMTEAWLLVDAYAIAAAADRPDALVSLPPVAQLDALASPKQVLEDPLLEAAGKPTGRRLKQFRRSLVDRRVNIASLIDDFSALHELQAFQFFMTRLAAAYPYGAR